MSRPLHRLFTDSFQTSSIRSRPAMSCPHIGQAKRPSGFVYKDECTQCFITDAHHDGVNVCLTCFNGGCTEHAAHHASLTGHQLVLNIVRTEAPRDAVAPDTEITKLAIGVAGGAAAAAKQYIYTRTVRCLACQVDVNASPSAGNGLAAIVEAVERADSYSKAQDVATWENQLETCEHALCLEQADPAPQLASKSLAKCQQCDIGDALWLCMTCGALGCSRKNFDGTGGNGHAVSHFEQTGHPLVCKMGTITPEGSADLYCYACDESRLDEQLTSHLGAFGIRVGEQTKTQKSMAELDLELNLKHDWSASYEAGKETPLIFGPGLTGIANLGNSCYMAAVLQSLLPLETFATRYTGAAAHAHMSSCRASHATCFHCQMCKMASGLASGQFSAEPAEFAQWQATRKQQMETEQSKDETDKLFREWQPGVTPRMFKTLIAGQHPEFKTNRQQDAFEFIQYFLNEVQRRERASGVDPTGPFQFQMQSRLQCAECNRVRYTDSPASDISLPVPVDESLLLERKDADGKVLPLPPLPPVTFAACVQKFAAAQQLDSYNCTHCGHRTRATQTAHFKSFPDTLVVHMARFVRPNWVPLKLCVAVDAPEQIDLEALRGRGLQAGEVALESSPAVPAAQPVADPEQVSTLMSMGFTQNACIRAVLAAGKGGVEASSAWLFEHLDDPNINDPIAAPAATTSATQAPVDEEAVAILMSMGFDDERAAHALRQVNGDTDRALDWLFSHADEPLPSTDSPAAAAAAAGPVAEVDSRPGRYMLHAFVTHLGTSTGCGHYVAHVRQADGSFAYFNDAKVSRSIDLPKEQAYIYIYKRA